MLIDKDAVINITAETGALETQRRVLDLPTVPDINRAAILRLCNEIEDIACDISNQTMNDVVYAEARMIFDKVKEIGKELTGDAGSKID